jgi:3',5'-cyclic AMP phosphodiesterase CpdA
VRQKFWSRIIDGEKNGYLMAQHLSIAVLSDPHFCARRPDGYGSEPSHIVIDSIYGGRDPLWSDLKALVDKQNLHCDLLLCPGDITNHANTAALECAWGELIGLGEKLKVQVVAAATGNHDVMSRPKGDMKNPVREMDDLPDPFESLRLLKPPYPIQVSAKKNDFAFHRDTRIHYFGADFVMYETDIYRLIVFNSCSRHTSEPSSYERGFIAHSTLEELKTQLTASSARLINILLCHHPPIPHDGSLGLYDLMKNGESLLKLLADHGDWLVIHGHKHHGRLRYSGGPNEPVIFAAASVGAVLPPQDEIGMRNQFYVLDVTLEEMGVPVGTLKVWNWYPDSGWIENYDLGEGLPTGCGFGEHRSREELAKEIATVVNGSVVSWQTVEMALPWLKHLPPQDFERILKTLEDRYQIKSEPINGRLSELGPIYKS